jgi:hypothetical protein
MVCCWDGHLGNSADQRAAPPQLHLPVLEPVVIMIQLAQDYLQGQPWRRALLLGCLLLLQPRLLLPLLLLLLLVGLLFAEASAAVTATWYPRDTTRVASAGLEGPASDAAAMAPNELATRPCMA